jgi:gas vesicle protein
MEADMYPIAMARLALAATLGAAVGALAVFVFDPVNGGRRRAHARDRAARYAREAVDAVESAARDVRNRAQSVAAEARSAVSNVMQWNGPERRTRPRDPINQVPGTGAE